MKQVVKKQYSKSANKTKFIYDDGSEEIVHGSPEKAQPIVSDDPGIAETAALQFGQGAAFGLGDEAYGVVKGVSDVVSDGDLDLDSLLKAYQTNRDVARARIAKSEEVNPTTATIANLAGSFAMPAGILGGTAKAATFGAKAMQGLKAGAAAGALTGLGQDEVDLTREGTVGQLAGDTAKSVAGGAVLGAGIGAVVPAVAKGLYDYTGLEKYRGTQKFKNAFNKAREGVEMLGPEALEREALKTRALGLEIADAVNDVKKYAGSIKGQALDSNAMPQDVHLMDMYNHFTEKIKNIDPASPEDEYLLRNFQKTLDKLVEKSEDFMGKKTISRPAAVASEIDNATMALNDILHNTKKIPYQSSKVGREIRKNLNDLTKKGLPEEGAKMFDIGKEGYGKAIEVEGRLRTPVLIDKSREAIEAFNTQLDNLASDISKTFKSPGSAGALDVKESIRLAKENVENIAKKLMANTTDVEEIARLTKLKNDQLAKITNVEKKIASQALDVSTAESMIGESAFGGQDALKKVSEASGASIVLGAARKAGGAVNFFETAAPNVVKNFSSAAYKKMYEKSSPELQKAYDILAQKSSPYADKLAFALKQDGRKRNAVLFSLMQQPDFRNAMTEIFGGE